MNPHSQDRPRMARDTVQPRRLNTATLRLKIGKASAVTKVQVSTAGLLVIGALVSSILLSTAVLVSVATATPRARPTLALLRRR